MSNVPKYVSRIARLPEVFARLAASPDGRALQDLAAEFDTTVAELREDLLAFYTADVGGVWGLSRPEVLEFLGPDGVTEDPGTADLVRLVSESPIDLGVEYVDAGELARVHAAAQALLEIEPDNTELAEALDVLAHTLFGEAASEAVSEMSGAGEGAGSSSRGAARNRLLPQLRQAQDEQRVVRIVYSRAWEPGVTEREIEPYRLVQTRRGWEVDAGPVDDQGRIRTYLLSNIRSAEVLDRAFVVPDDVAELLARQRATTRVRVLLPQESRWVADFYAEQVTFVEDDERDVVVDLELLPPVEDRVGRLLVTAGPTATVLDPPALDSAGVVLAEELLVHHTSGAVSRARRAP
ncbi:helix-turn-helix transcriptional regulator [Nocardioides daeguensis]|uniref:WYL domain-containing protein n=1 Tax=Nocardioides daeguensis TaxID=908359 RepID=A0ABP6UQ37_9ACTN|nr:WYL domain-containing protein [Nocardioides daeguensis]MBV6729206.1 WYL domain-containing protein [Nocardioides daeguensis]MCR1774773.1 WYL domain-containing protein [Nocardioides daeguensis]